MSTPMIEIANPGTYYNGETPSREDLLAAIDCGQAHLRLLQLKLEEITVLLASDKITPQQAIDWVYNVGAIALVWPPTVEAQGVAA